jgi:hypothetical protein
MLSPRALLLLFAMFLLGAASRMLSKLNVEGLLLGLSSDFWAGVCGGISLACGLWLIATIVSQHIVSSRRSP